jgi:hypothetical protein
MRSLSLYRAATLIAVALAAASVSAEEGYRHGRVRYLDPGVTIQRATEAGSEEAVPNQPFLPGDRVWTDGGGRVEFQFPDGTTVRLDSRSKLDYSGHEEGREERIVLRLWSGSLVVRVRTRDAGHFQVETPAGMVEASDRAMVRVDVDGGEARVSVYRGEAMLDDGQRRTRVPEGERTFACWGGDVEEPSTFDVREEDDFSRWDADRDVEDDRAARSSEYLPKELNAYAGEFENHGSWHFEAGIGFVWAPQVAAGWAPYSSGFWSWTPYGWTWIPNESWGWAPFHYGRWGYSVSLGWYWAPGHTWGPGWVSWGVGNGYVAWSPLGWHDQPVYAWGAPHGAVPRYGSYGGWNVVHTADFGHRDVAQRRVPVAGIDPRALRIADAPNLRPTRDVHTLLAGNPEAHAISRRPSPGDFVRELSVDNKYTIPATWLHARPRKDADPPRDEHDSRAPIAIGTDPQAHTNNSTHSAPWFVPGAQDASGSADHSSSSHSEAARRSDSPRSRDDADNRHESPRVERAQPRERDSSHGDGSHSSTDTGSSHAAHESASSHSGHSDSGQSQSHGDSGKSHSDSGHAAPRKPHDH